jgi:DNA-binding beta-propeller fold protein YncE
LFGTIGFFASSVAAQQAVPSGTIETFPAGDSPWDLAFDGENIWVTNILFDGAVTNVTDGFVTKLRASDGEILGRLFVLDNPMGITFDGANVWVGHRSGPPREEGSVTKIRASDIQVLGVFPAGPRPGDLTFDGANIWVVNRFAESVTKLRASDGALLGTFPVGLHGNNLAGIVFDDGNIWVADSNTSRVFRLRASDGEFLGQHKVGREGAWGIASDGIHLWVTNFQSDTVVRLGGGDPTQFYPVGDTPRGVLFDGTSIWVANNGDDTVTKITPDQP